MAENPLQANGGQTEIPKQPSISTRDTSVSTQRRVLTTAEVVEQLRRVCKPGSVKPYIGKPEDRNII